jgi:transcriptional regulator with XRE-family HTH domain
VPARVNPDVPGERRLASRVGTRIRQLREARGLTMAELGADRRGRVYFQRQYVWKMETGRVTPSLPALAHFAKRLRVSLSDILRGIG